MKKKKLSLTGLEVKSFVTNLDGNLSKTVKGGDSLNNNCGGSGVPGCDNPDPGTIGCTALNSDCSCRVIESWEQECFDGTIAPACPSGIGCGHIG